MATAEPPHNAIPSGDEATEKQNTDLLISITEFFRATALPALERSLQGEEVEHADDDASIGSFGADLLRHVQKSVHNLELALSGLKGLVLLPQPQVLLKYKIENKPTSYMRAASMTEVVHECEGSRCVSAELRSAW